MQSFNDVGKVMTIIFNYLNLKDVLNASRVCVAWNIIAMSKPIWRDICLKDIRINDWEKFVHNINRLNTISLDTKLMILPENAEKLERFWINFSQAMKKVTRLQSIKMYQCPSFVVESIIESLPQLVVFNAMQIKNISLKGPIKLDLINLGKMSNLSEFKIMGIKNIILTRFSNLEALTHLNNLCMTKICVFPKDMCNNLSTICDSLQFLSLGNCVNLSIQFADVLNKFKHLKYLRLEKNLNRADTFHEDVFKTIRNLKELKVLELPNNDINKIIINELQNYNHINMLYIAPKYSLSSIATTNSRIISSIDKITKCHVVWGIPHYAIFNKTLDCNEHTTPKNDYLSILKDLFDPWIKQFDFYPDFPNNISFVTLETIKMKLQSNMTGKLYIKTGHRQNELNHLRISDILPNEIKNILSQNV